MNKCPTCGMEEVMKLGDIISPCDCVVPEEVEESLPEEVIEEEDADNTEEEEAKEEVVEEEESLDDEDLEAYLEELPVKELKKLCKEADLSNKGKKADLVARLLE